ncbi:S9 family peptidase [Cyclobacterium jeungdonense]|uniref:DPP IV N-terminal domain-containing protein n=1 Tax=Cyclobacterium jeungdonense TaxID=708087 RepID=A0ABT8C9R5_9BACT|nr:DPP IV N-terminal domain-containing protein [Cyclobacterium jeungdonense]MDN3689543.1 DPP IV N-terminal domain-containing protein [Cyclobacterium jeungdonense]
MIKNPLLLVLVLLVQAAFLSNIGCCQIVVPELTKERLKEIYDQNIFSVKSFNGRWLPDGSGYLLLENLPGENKKALVNYDVPGDKRTVLISPEDFDRYGYTGPFTIEDYVMSSDGEKILVQMSGRDTELFEPDYWMLDRKTGANEKVVAGRNNRISPDGTQILYTEQGDLYVYNLITKNTTRITFDANSETVTNGRAVWSPDGTHIAFVQSDVKEVRKRTSLVPGDPSYPEIKEQRFARVGGDIAVLRVGVVDTSGKETRWLPIPIPKEGYYVGEVSWAGNSEEVLVEKRSRFRDQRQFLIANIDNGSISTIYEESDPAWVVASYGTNGGVDWISDTRNFIVLTEKDGWRHAYLMSSEGKKEILLTPGDYDIIGRAGMDEDKGWFYYYASPDNGTQKYLYRVGIDGKGKAERVTPIDQPGTHNYTISPEGNWAFHTFSSANTPPVTELVSLPEHKVERVLEGNIELHEKVKLLDPQPKEFFRFDIGNGVVMDAWMIKPVDFDSTAKYPVFVYVYGEPHGQTVMDSWGHAMTEYHRVIADLGYLVVSFDNRGTPSPKGAAWRRAVAGSLGPLSSDEQAAALQELARTRPYVDLSRVGIWGWSGGGSNTLNAMFRKPNVYDVGIAVAPKPQPHLYNAWFQEIYMDTPEVNPEGYRKSAPINFAEGLKGNLLIIHGTGETNTHLEITEGLVDRLIELGKPFDYMAYPNRNHGLSEGKGTSLHLRLYMVRYLLNHLPAGPR